MLVLRHNRLHRAPSQEVGENTSHTTQQGATEQPSTHDYLPAVYMLRIVGRDTIQRLDKLLKDFAFLRAQFVSR